MKQLTIFCFSIALALMPVAAFGQAAVNIVYPIDGSTYPIVDITPIGVVSSTYFTSSFSTTCPGGQNTVRWGFDGNSTGSATFYDQFSAQFVHKLAAGVHTFDVVSSCGSETVTFRIG